MKLIIPILLMSLLTSCATTKKHGCGLSKVDKKLITYRSTGEVASISEEATLIRIQGAVIKDDTAIVPNLKFIIAYGKLNKTLQPLVGKCVSFECTTYFPITSINDEVVQTVNGCIEQIYLQH